MIKIEEIKEKSREKMNELRSNDYLQVRIIQKIALFLILLSAMMLLLIMGFEFPTVFTNPSKRTDFSFLNIMILIMTIIIIFFGIILAWISHGKIEKLTGEIDAKS